MTAIVAAVALVSHAIGAVGNTVGALFAFLGSTSGLWFPLTGALATLGQQVGAIPAGLTSTLLTAGAALYGLYLGRSLLIKISRKFTP